MLKDTKTAWAVTAVAIALSAFLGCNRSLAQLRSATAEGIVKGDEYGYCIATDSQDLVDTARNLITVSKKYLPASDSTLAGLQTVLTRMEKADKDAAARKSAAVDIRDTAEKLIKKLEDTGSVTERDMGYLAGFQTEITGALHRMERDPYNAAAEKFNGIEGAFPANLLGVFVRPLETFDF